MNIPASERNDKLGALTQRNMGQIFLGILALFMPRPIGLRLTDPKPSWSMLPPILTAHEPGILGNLRTMKN